MSAPDIIKQLVERFENNREAYGSSKYNETQARREFIDPFFKALGWDVDNEQGWAEQYKDVIHEDSLEIEGETKAPDYAFRVGGVRKFFVEAKKPYINIQSDIHPAFQLRRYAWSAKLPLSILTDFEEFAVYDCRPKPDKRDKASTSRVMLYTYKDYLEKWDEIAAVFSRDAILKGSFDKFAEGTKGKKGTAEVDDAFLAEIERWRDLLARNIALRNQSLSVRELNFAVQMTIDRIIFLRICEDRGIEPYGRLKELLTPPPASLRDTSPANGEGGAGVYQELCRLFKLADARYNSGLFHFKDEKDQSGPADSLTLSLNVDDKVLKDILVNLYYPESPYVFSEIPSDILGQVYERFLGKVIRLTAGHQAKVEEKPEVRKAGGVYYTPTYIVDYIVKNTVGNLVDGLTPRDVAGLRILDPACGSGTFPLGAFQFLLDWHLEWYLEDGPEKQAKGKEPPIYESKDGWRLTTAKKKEILLNNIYGVDIDAQAVEVTKLSLLLKVLEGESEETVGTQLGLFAERVLPDLSANIKCGNSLIGPDYYEGRQLTMNFVDNEERWRVNAFDWKAEFPRVFMQGGFDAVIGNPPYIRIQAMQEYAPTEVEFYKKAYKAASKGNYDIYVVFVEKGLSLLSEKGRLGFILPHKFFNAKYGEPVRNVISQGDHLAKVVHFGDQQVFENATTYTCLMFLNKIGKDEFEFEKVHSLDQWRTYQQTSEVSETSEVSTVGKIDADHVQRKEWNFVVGKGAGLFEKLSQMPLKLGDVADRMAQGIRTSANEIYVVDYISRSKELVVAYSKQLDKNVQLEKGVLSPFLQGREIKRYRTLPSGKMVIIPYHTEENQVVFNSNKYMKENFPQALAYLLENKVFLENREKGKMRGSSWYAFVYPKNIELMKQSKILIPDISDRAQFAIDENGEYAFTSGYG